MSIRAVDEWLSLFDDPILGNSALDRLANASYQIVIEGASYREKLSPHRKLLGDRQDDCKVIFYPLMVSLSNHRWLVWASFDKLRMSRNR